MKINFHPMHWNLSVHRNLLFRISFREWNQNPSFVTDENVVVNLSLSFFFIDINESAKVYLFGGQCVLGEGLDRLFKKCFRAQFGIRRATLVGKNFFSEVVVGRNRGRLAEFPLKKWFRGELTLVKTYTFPQWSSASAPLRGGLVRVVP